MDGGDEFARLGIAFNEMADQLEARLEELGAERARLRDATVRFGDALAATHDVDQLLRVIVETVVETTGATGGLVVGLGGEIVQSGTLSDRGENFELPLTAGRQSFGTLTLSGRGFTVEQRRMAASLVAHAAIALENARLHRIVARQALVDMLTGLANRRHCEEALAGELMRAERFGGSVAFVLADLDSFKSINDRFGHPVGDGVLVEFAETLRECVREIDVPARWGGEEFAIVLPGHRPRRRGPAGRARAPRARGADDPLAGRHAHPRHRQPRRRGLPRGGRRRGPRGRRRRGALRGEAGRQEPGRDRPPRARQARSCRFLR